VSGVILVALTKRAANLLSQQFESRKVQKRYLAWVQGDATRCQTQWHDLVQKVPDEPRCEIAETGAADAKSAVTTMRVIEKTETATLLELSPLTGRMHQLRVQCAHRGLPILGDSLYGSTVIFSGDSPDNQDCSETNDEAHKMIAAYPPIALHAWSIEFHDPTNGKRILVQADPLWQQSAGL
jgi:23S rRNA-/tRNA-specific pseudouridylate synthase